MKDISIFNFSDYKKFLLAVGMPEGNYSHSSNNLQKWSKRLGYKSPSTLSMVLKGQRLPSYQLIMALASDLNLKPKEKEYFETLILLEKKKNKNQDIESLLKRLDELRGSENQINLDLDLFKSISRWYFTPIKQLISHPDFIEDEQWIAKKMRFKVTPSQIRHAIKTLIELGLIERDESKRLIPSKKGIKSQSEIPSSAIRMHHSGMIERAHESIEGISMNERLINGLTFCLEDEKIDDAKNDLLNFIKDFNKKYAKQGSGEVYQLNLQLFPHTKRIHTQ